MTVSIHVGNALDVLRGMPDNSVHCVVTSPPYWGLRDYGVEGQIGLEPTPEAYIETMVRVFNELRRVLRGDGTLWLNIGDTYSNVGKNGGHSAGKNQSSADGGYQTVRNNRPKNGLPAKQMYGIPWRVALALQADGWWLRSDIIWHKPNPLPESVTDRPTKAHEYVFLLTKSASYFYDLVAVLEPSTGQTGAAADFRRETKDALLPSQSAIQHRADREPTADTGTRNRRTVWTIPTAGFAEAHFATFPPALVEPCVLAGTSERGCCPRCGKPWERAIEKVFEPQADINDQDALIHAAARQKSTLTGWDGFPRGTTRTTTTGWRPGCECDAGDPVPCTVIDPFGGAGTTGLVADRLGRDAILIELNPDYAEMARRRIAGDAPLFADVEVL